MTSLLSTWSGKTNSRHWGGMVVPLCFHANALCRSEQNSSSTPCLLVAFGGPHCKTLDDDDDGRQQRRASVCLCCAVGPKTCCWSHCPRIKDASSPAVELASGGCRDVLLMLIESTLSQSQSECPCVLSILDPCPSPAISLSLPFSPHVGYGRLPVPTFWPASATRVPLSLHLPQTVSTLATSVAN